MLFHTLHEDNSPSGGAEQRDKLEKFLGYAPGSQKDKNDHLVGFLLVDALVKIEGGDLFGRFCFPGVSRARLQ